MDDEAMRASASTACAGGLGGALAGAFWIPAIGSSAATIGLLCREIDRQSLQIARLPLRPASRRPLIGHYLAMVKTLAAAWRGRTRIKLAGAMAGLDQVGERLIMRDGPALLAEADGHRAARIVDGILRRLASPLDAFAELHRDLDCYLAQMAAASADLEADTLQATQHLQAEQVHAFILAQQVHMLQAQLDEARERLHAPAPGLEELIRQEVAVHAASLDSVRSQLGQIQSSQAEIVAEAACLQGLLPAVASYLDQFERIGIAIHAMLAASCALQAGLGTARLHLLDGGAPGPLCQAVLAALPGWDALASAAGAASAQEASRSASGVPNMAS